MRLILALLVFSSINTASAHASTPEYFNKLADAIYRAEGGPKAKVPYGILSVKTNNPRKTCLEVIRWRYAIWSGTPSLKKYSFLEYLSQSYAPVGAKNDPTNLNRHWISNVSYFMGVNHG